MNRSIMIMVLGMALVTYLPRAIPAVLVDRMRLGPGLEKFLKLIPYTAMAALIFPGVISVDSSNPLIGIAGGLTALVLAIKKLPVMVCVLGAIGVDFLLYVFI